MIKKVDFGKNCMFSISVILLYFFWPTILKAFWETFGGGKNVNVGMIIYNLIGYAILVVILFLIYQKSLKEEWKIFKKSLKKNIIGILKYTILLFVSIIVTKMLINSVFHVEAIENETQLLGNFADSPIWTAILLIVYYPIVEVIVFQKTIKQVIKNEWLFIIISSLFFGYFNIAFSEFSWESLIGMAPYVISNAILAISYTKYDTIVAPIGIKMLYNLLVTIISFG